MKDGYELQLIDCNCNDCAFMERDLERFKAWKEAKVRSAAADFKKKKAVAIASAEEIFSRDPQNGKGMLRVAKKMRFQFQSESMINYGRCRKFEKDVSFIPRICQLETQECFKHRKDGRT